MGRRVRRWPLAALLAALIILAFESFVALRPDLFTDGIYWTTVAKRKLLKDTSLQEDVLVFGDSRAFSIQPRLVAEALGGRDTVTNYSWAYMGADAYGYFLDVYLRLKRPPRLILVNPLPEIVALPPRMLSLEDNPSHRTRLFTALPAGALMAELAGRRKWNLVWGLAEQLAMPPSLARRDRVWRAMKSLATGHGFPELSELDRFQIEGMKERGAYLMHLDNVVPKPVFAQVERLNGPYAVHENREAVAAYERFLEQARRAGIQVRMIGIPFPATLYDRYEQVGALDAYRKLLERWSREFPNFGVIEPVLMRWPDERFGDAGHLNRPGDALYQQALKNTLERFASAEAGRTSR